MHQARAQERLRSVTNRARTLATRTRCEPRRWTPTPDEAARYTMGGCWPLALALHRITGLTFVAVVADSYCYEWGTTEEVVQHVMLRVGSDRFLDVNGIASWRRHLRTLDDEYDVDASRWRTNDVDERFLRSTARESDGQGGRRLSALKWYPEAPALARRIADALALPRAKTGNNGDKASRRTSA